MLTNTNRGKILFRALFWWCNLIKLVIYLHVLDTITEGAFCHEPKYIPNFIHKLKTDMFPWISNIFLSN